MVQRPDRRRVVTDAAVTVWSESKAANARKAKRCRPHFATQRYL